jgi:hypothetical protein
MNDLIWVGNTLYPRWIVFAAIGLIVFTIVGLFVMVTDRGSSTHD